LTPGFKAEYDAAVNVAVNQGLSLPFSFAASARLSVEASRAQTGQFSAAVSLGIIADLSPAVSRVANRVSSPVLTCVFSLPSSAALSRGSNGAARAGFRPAANQPVLAPMPWPAEELARGPFGLVLVGLGGLGTRSRMSDIRHSGHVPPWSCPRPCARRALEGKRQLRCRSPKICSHLYLVVDHSPTTILPWGERPGGRLGSRSCRCS